MNTVTRPHRGLRRGGRRPSPDGLLDDAGTATAADLLTLDGTSPEHALALLDTSELGLPELTAVRRLGEYGLNELPTVRPSSASARLSAAVRSPFVGLLAALDLVVAVTGDPLGVAVITTMVAASLALRLRQERRFGHLLASLRGLALPRVAVLRRPGRGNLRLPAVRDRNPRLLVPGDVITLETGDVVPADCRVIAAQDFTIDQAVLTGESVPVPKFAHPLATAPGGWLDRPDQIPITPGGVLAAPTLCLTGSSVASGRATLVVAKTGARTLLAATTRKLAAPRRPTAADLGLRSVTWQLIRLLAALIPAVYVLTVTTSHNIDPGHAALFAVAIAVGLVPEMLPVILAAAHGRGLSMLAAHRIVATRPSVIQDLAAIDILCTDKTGTLTVGRPQLTDWVAPDGGQCPQVLEYALLQAGFATDRHSPLDAAILDQGSPLDAELARARYDKVDEIGFDHTRRRGSVILDPGTGPYLMITKGAVAEVLAACTQIRSGAGQILTLTPQRRAAVEERCRRMWAEGHRLLAIGYRDTDADPDLVPDLSWEAGLTLAGLLAFTDPPKPGTAAAIDALARQGIRTLVLTGDAPQVATALCAQAGIVAGTPATGADIDRLGDSALASLAGTTSVFAAVDPLHKARIIHVLRQAGHAVGFLGDGLNDTPALRAADAGLAVTDAAPVARYAADAVLLDKDLGILAGGVTAARQATLNATKYLKATLSANLGNVLSVLAASAFLPFLPMLPLQLLIANLCYDLTQLALPTDRADPSQLARPHRWSGRDLARFIACLAPLSSAFDLATFALLRHTTHALPESQQLFHTGWYIESLLTQLLAVLIIRTATTRPWRTRPALLVMLATLVGTGAALALPYSRLAAPLGLHPLAPGLLAALIALTGGYLVCLYLTKLGYQRLTGRWL